MPKRLAAVLVVIGVAGAMLATFAPAQVTQVKTTLSIGFTPTGTGGASFSGKVTAHANHFCLERRTIELFHDGVKVGTGRSDNYSNWQIILSSAPSGTYLAKTKKKQLPASLQQKPGPKNRIFCKAATSPPVTVP